jgi:hypothetical protein
LPASRIEGNGKRSLRRPNLSTIKRSLAPEEEEEEVICSLEIGLIHFGFERGRKCIFLFGRIF